jgi:hypothetical protein
MEITTKKKSNYKLLATAISGIVVGSALILLAYLVGPDKNEYPITYIICISGYILGWIVAIISTPMNAMDEHKIGRFTKTVGAFLSGYILSKTDRVFDIIFDPASIFDPLAGARVLLFICCFGLTFILVFYYRQYKWKVPA